MTAWLKGNAGREAAETIGRAVDAEAVDLIDLLDRLIGARSVNPPGDVTAPAAVVGEVLDRHGLAFETVSAVDEKPNILSRTDGRGSGRHLILNGHLDTISPGDEDDWTVPVYAMSRQEDRLHGLGAGNMKGAVAALTWAYAWLAAHRDLWPGRITYSAVADETIFGPDGAGFLLDHRPDLIGDAVICGEGPGGMELAIAEKGLYWMALEASAPPGQGMVSQRGTSAITRLAAALAEIDALNDWVATPPDEVACLGPHAGAHGLRVSANVGTVAGGRFVSQAASQATAEIDFRIPPGLSMAEIEARVDGIVAGHEGLSRRRLKGWEPNWTPLEDPFVDAFAAAAGTVLGRAPKPVVRLPASDASRWRARGVPAVCFGPQPTLASGVDDYVYERDVVACAKIYALAALAYLNS